MPRILKSVPKYSCIKSRWISLMRDAGVDDAHTSLREIMTAVIGRRNVFAPEFQMTAEQCKEIENMCLQRSKRKPLQYVIGEWDFRDLTLKMRQPVFVPRPETEQLAELAVAAARARFHRNVLEVGCGSGAITLSLLHQCSHVRCTAVDCSLEACKLTLENASFCRLDTQRLRVLQCPLTPEGRLDCAELQGAHFDLVVSNPPYVTTGEMRELQPEIKRYEDECALWGGVDGLNMVRSLLKLCGSHALNPGGTLLMEVGLEHPALLRDMLTNETVWSPLRYQGAHKDFTGRERFVEIVKDG